MDLKEHRGKCPDRSGLFVQLMSGKGIHCGLRKHTDVYRCSGVLMTVIRMHELFYAKTWKGKGYSGSFRNLTLNRQRCHTQAIVIRKKTLKSILHKT